LCEEGYTVIIPDYRGYYKSTGGHSYFYSGESVDLLNAANILKMQYKITDIYLIGYSWGGGISLFAAESFAAVSEKLFQKIVLYYPQLGGLDISQREYLFLKAKFGFSGKQIFDLFRKKSPLYNYHKLSKIPILIFHGKQDKVVKLNQS
jgi:pimeloyl-ACP methyl ester carboxylesterase